MQHKHATASACSQEDLSQDTALITAFLIHNDVLIYIYGDFVTVSVYYHKSQYWAAKYSIDRMFNPFRKNTFFVKIEYLILL